MKSAIVGRRRSRGLGRWLRASRCRRSCLGRGILLLLLLWRVRVVQELLVTWHVWTGGLPKERKWGR